MTTRAPVDARGGCSLENSLSLSLSLARALSLCTGTQVKGARHNNIETAFFQEYCQRLQDFVWSLDPKWQLKPGTVFAL